MAPFEFATATQIIFGRGSSQRLAEIVSAPCRRVLWVTGSDPERFAHLRAGLERAGVAVHSFAVSAEPTTERANQGVDEAREHRCDGVVAIGGGSALDLGKAVAALLANGGAPLDYLEVVGKGRRLERPSAPFFAVPTTSGTGAEVTKNAVLESKEHGVKVSLRSLFMLPRLALIDSELSHSVPSGVTAATGLDALTQCLEPYVSRYNNPLTDALCLEGLRRGARSLERAFIDGSDAEAREDLALTSLFGGLALANAKLGAVHGFAGPIGGLFPAPHGAICARLLPEVMRTNIRALKRRTGLESFVERYATVAQILTGRADARPEDGIDWVRTLCEKLEIPRLGAYGLDSWQADAVVAKAERASSMQGNPIELGPEELRETLLSAI